MPRKTQKWKTISLPEKMVEKIKEIIKNHPERGYRSVAGFITAAIRDHPDYKREYEENS